MNCVPYSYEYIESIKRRIRRSGTNFDGEIMDLIEAARSDLKLIGIKDEKVDDVKDKLINQAIVLYVKAEFGIDNDDSEKYRQSYEMLKNKLSLSSEYMEETDNVLE